jgi:hypothetical protein
LEDVELGKEDKNYGPVTDALNADWSAWKIPGYSREAIDLRIRRRIARGRMLRFRPVPVMRRAWYVTLTATVADREADFGSHDLVHGLTFTPKEFWCLSRRKARALVERDKRAGGTGTMYPVEYRLCPVCGRQLLGTEAHDYRMKQLRPVREWHFPEGPACNLECKPHGRGPGGQPMYFKRGRDAE